MEPDWLKTAREKGLSIKSVGVQSSALAAAGGGVAAGVPSAILDTLDEATWQQIVVGHAEARGHRVAHCRKVKVKRGKREWWETTMPAGWFDLVIVRDRVLFVELKVEPNVRTAEQEAWAMAMCEAGQAVRLWYPRHWPEVMATLY